MEFFYHRIYHFKCIIVVDLNGKLFLEIYTNVINEVYISALADLVLSHNIIQQLFTKCLLCVNKVVDSGDMQTRKIS